MNTKKGDTAWYHPLIFYALIRLALSELTV